MDFKNKSAILKTRLLKYDNKSRSKTKIFFQRFSNEQIIDMLFQIVNENPCEIHYIIDLLFTIKDIMPSPLSVNSFVSHILESDSMIDALFIQQLIYSGIFKLSDFSDVKWLFSINHFEFAHFSIHQSKILMANKIRLEKKEERKQSVSSKEKVLKENMDFQKKDEISNKKFFDCGILHFSSKIEMQKKLIDEIIKKIQGNNEEDFYLLKTFSSLVYTLDPHCFDIIRNFLPLFCETTVRNFICPLKYQMRDSIRDYKQIPIIINHFYPKNHKIIYATLAGDAAQMYEKDIAKNLYCFELLPVESIYNVASIHFQFFDKGSAPPILREIFKDIIKELRKLDVRVIFTATDGEKAIDKTHNDFFNQYILKQINKPFFEIVDSFSIDDIIPLSDILHLLKNARSHILDHLIFIDAQNLISVNKYLMSVELGFPRFITDTSKESRMKDGYAIEFFSWKTFVELERAGRYDASFFILPFLCLQESVRSSSLTCRDRLCFLEIAFKCFIFTYSQIINKSYPKYISEVYSSDSVGTYIGSKTWIIRCINTTIGIARAINLHIKGFFNNLHLGRLSSHDVECFFGMLRRLALGNESTSMAIDIVLKSMLYKIILNETNITFTKKTRVNAGGVIMKNYSPDDINLPISASNIFDTSYLLMRGFRLSYQHYGCFASQLNCYTQKILHDPKYPKLLKSKPYSGNSSTYRQRLPYGSTVIPMEVGSNGVVSPANREIKLNTIFHDTTIVHDIVSTIDHHESTPDVTVTSEDEIKFENKGDDEEIKQETDNDNDNEKHQSGLNSNFKTMEQDKKLKRYLEMQKKTFENINSAPSNQKENLSNSQSKDPDLICDEQEEKPLTSLLYQSDEKLINNEFITCKQYSIGKYIDEGIDHDVAKDYLSTIVDFRNKYRPQADYSECDVESLEWKLPPIKLLGSINTKKFTNEYE